VSGNADWRARLTRLQLDIGQHWIVRRVLAVMDVTNRAGGPLLAAALAFGTMFAVIPTVLLLSGVLGWIVDDPQLRNELLVELIGAFPPLADVFEDSLEAVVDARGALTIVGLVGLLWGASNFYANLEAVMVRIFEGGEPRDMIRQRVRGFLTVVVLVGLVIATIGLSGFFAFVQATVEGVIAWQAVALAVPLAVMVVVVWLCYRLVPTAPPSWGAAFVPAVIAGIGIGLLTNVFSVLAPLLLAGLSGFGVIATVFGALIWLNLCFQLLLYGAAWARYRRDREAIVGGPLPGL
jgi:membrane protein